MFKNNPFDLFRRLQICEFTKHGKILLEGCFYLVLQKKKVYKTSLTKPRSCDPQLLNQKKNIPSFFGLSLLIRKPYQTFLG